MTAFGDIQYAHLNQNPEVADLMHQIWTRLRNPYWNISFRFAGALAEAIMVNVVINGPGDGPEEMQIYNLVHE